MQGNRSTRATAAARAAAASAVAAAVFAGVPVGLAADSSGGLRAQAQRQHATAAQVELELYALESQLTRAQAEAEALHARRSALQAEQVETRTQLQHAARAAQVAQERLRELVRALYAQDAPDPLAVVLGSTSLDEALTGLEHLDRSAEQTIRIGERATAARTRLARLEARLADRTAELAAVAARAEARAAELRSRRAQRASYVAAVRSRAQLTERQLAAAQERARAAQWRTPLPTSAEPATPAAPAPTAASTPAPVEGPAPEAAPGRTLRVVAVAYSLQGTTATGLPVGPGVVAVDPSVIPLGTRLHVPGYGDAVAADTGGAVRGAMIDVWLPTLAQARAWGRRSVVVTFR